MVELPAADTGVAPFVVVGDLAAAEHSAHLEHTAAMTEVSSFNCTMIVVQIVAADSMV